MSTNGTAPDSDRAMPLTAGEAAAALLDWYAAVGVDDVVADAGTDWFGKADSPPGDELRRTLRRSALAAPASGDEALPQARGPAGVQTRTAGEIGGAAPARPQPPRSAEPRPSPVPDAAQADARRAAEAAPDLAALVAAISGFEGCTLKATATSTCVYRGADKARIAVIGEAPGRDEDIAGRPFVGRAGQLLDRMLAAIGLDETNTHITNVVYWRPPGNRAPTPQEALACRPFLERQIALVDPDVVLLMGGSAAKQILETNEGIMRTRGKLRSVVLAGRERKAMATLHPAYLLRTPAAKHMAWKDLLGVKKYLEN